MAVAWAGDALAQLQVPHARGRRAGAVEEVESQRRSVTGRTLSARTRK
jgi:hypothetical protein